MLHILQMKKELPMHRSPLDWGMMMAPVECADCGQTKFLYSVQNSLSLDTGDLLYTSKDSAWRLLSLGCNFVYSSVCFMHFLLVKLVVPYI